MARAEGLSPKSRDVKLSGGGAERRADLPATVFSLADDVRPTHAIIVDVLARANLGENVIVTPGIQPRNVETLSEVFRDPTESDSRAIAAVGIGQQVVVEGILTGVSDRIRYAGSAATLDRMRRVDAGEKVPEVNGLNVGIVSTDPKTEKARALEGDFVHLGIHTTTPETPDEASLTDRVSDVVGRMRKGEKGLLIIEDGTDGSVLQGFTPDMQRTLEENPDLELLLLTKPDDEQDHPVDSPTSSSGLAAITEDEDYALRTTRLDTVAGELRTNDNLASRVHSVHSSRHFGFAIASLPQLINQQTAA